MTIFLHEIKILIKVKFTLTRVWQSEISKFRNLYIFIYTYNKSHLKILLLKKF